MRKSQYSMIQPKTSALCKTAKHIVLCTPARFCARQRMALHRDTGTVLPAQYRAANCTRPNFSGSSHEPYVLFWTSVVFVRVFFYPCHRRTPAGHDINVNTSNKDHSGATRSFFAVESRRRLTKEEKRCCTCRRLHDT